ncbi:MAG: HYR domain-containing protein, partial [Saprospiraceae bacterium]
MISPQDLVVDCNNTDITTIISSWVSNNLGGMAVDGCGGTLSYVVTPGTAVTTCGGGYITQYAINVSDDCGNNITSYASLIVVDNTAPVLTLPTDGTTISCEDDFGTALDTWLNTASATDECGGTTTISYGLVSEETECVGTATVTTYTYMFTAADECGNVITGESTFIVQDNTAPTITAPMDLNISCGDPAATEILSWLEAYTVTESCSDYTVTNNYDGSLPAACGGSKTVTWTVTDGCGASATATANIVMATDVTPPVFSNCPSDITVYVDVDLCTSNVIYSTPVATDCNSPVTVTLTSGIASGQAFPLGDTEITFTATDACNNTAECTFTITVEDSQIPSITCPVNEVTVCTEETSCEWSSDAAINATYNDNCAGSTLSYSITGETTGTGTGIVPAGTMFALGTSTVTYTVTADNNQTATCSFDVVVEDCTAPQITCPSDLTVECGEDVDAIVATWDATVTDNCTTSPTVNKEFVYTNVNCCSGASRLYLFTATDEAGNTAECYAQVNIVDTTPPVITSATSVTEECSGDSNIEGFVTWVQNHGGATATDACGDVTWTSSYDLNLGCGNSGSTEVTFTATDECGNTSSTTATYTIEDTTPPVVTAPASITLECGNLSNTAIINTWLTTATSTDECSEVTITNDYVTGSETLDCTGASGLTVTFTATDDCSNESTATSTIYVTDTKKPVIAQSPTDLYVECTDANIATLISTWETAYGNGVSTDECDANLTVSFTAGTAVTLCGGSTETPYTYTATDACGNSVTTYATLTIYDNTAPVLTLPTATSSVSCSDDVQAALDTWLASASATDECGGNTTLTYSLVYENTECNGTNTETVYTYLFEAEDDCGNSTNNEAEFTIYDDEAPSITAPSDLTVSCGDDIAAAIIPWLEGYTVTESCQDYTVTNDYDGTIPNLCGGSLTVTWTVSDECGASATATADLIVSPDTDGPEFLNCPGNMTVTTDVDLCGSYVIYSTPVATDCNLPVDVVLTSGPASGTLFNIGNNEITFTATDACNNETECTFTIAVIDEDVPMILCPSNDVVVCNDEGECSWEATAAVNPTGIENCPGAEITYEISGATTVTGPVIGSAAGETFNLGTSVVTYTITDGSNNVSSCSFNVIVEDCEDPTIECPSDITTVNDPGVCGAVVEFADPVVDDNCPLPSVFLVQTSGLPSGSVFPVGTTTNTFVVTDNAGNTAECSFDVTVTDEEIPAIDCSGLDITTTTSADGITGDCSYQYSWEHPQVTDNCGISTYTIVYQNPDNSVEGPYNVYVGSSSTGTILDPVRNFEVGTTTVTYYVEDIHGNTNTCSFTVTVTDDESPIWDPEPQDLTIECDGTTDPYNQIQSWLNTNGGGIASDNCGEITYTNNYTGFTNGCSQYTGTAEVTFTATDESDNSTSVEVTLTVVDNLPPTITTEAQDTVVECDGQGNTTELQSWLDNHAGATAEDACSETLTWQTPQLMNSQYTCGNTATYTYSFSVTDECGNESTSTVATFTIEDTTAPVITTQASDLTVECNGNGNLSDRTTWLNNHAGAVATDLCGGTTWSWDLINTIDQCGYTGEYTYRFTVTDDCGNESYTEATFTIEDTTAPDITNEAQNMTVECNGANNSADILNWLNNNGFATASEGCGSITWTNDYGTITGGCGATGAVEVTFTATDECGNASTTTATFTIIDETAPVWEILPQNLTIECDGSNDPYDQIQAWLDGVGGGEAEDDCSLVVYTNDYTELSDECGNTGSALVTFTATDACGNPTEATATVTVVDNVAPEITTAAQDTTVECDGQGNTTDLQSWLDNHGGAQAADACSEPLTWEYTLTGTTENCGYTSVAVYVFTATDDCGNVSVETTASFTIEDTTSPTIENEAQNETVECDGTGNTTERETWLNNHGGATASDICSEGLNWSWDLINTIDQCGYTGEYTYRFTVTDDCGNESYSEATFIIEDTTAPEITSEAQNMTVECNGANNSADILNWLNNNGFATASEACGSITWTNDYGTITGGCGTTGEVEVTFTATDECGNASTTTAIFTINDNTPPSWEIQPQNLTIECDGSNDPYEQIQAWLEGVGGGEAEDSCSLVVYTNDYTELSDECGNTGSALVTFTATDGCGNYSETTATVTVVDNVAPEITTEARDTTVECDGQGNITDLQSWLDNHGGSQASDACSEPLTWENELISTEEGCGGTSVSRYTFRAIDDCGNVSVNTEATFTIEDTTIPVFDVLPQDSIVQCDGTGNQSQLMGWLSENANLEASDICSSISDISFDLVKETDLCGLTATYLYRFTIVDECGNENTAEATFSIVDTLAPVITGGADMGMEECSSPPAGNYPEFDYWLENNAGATAEDGCGDFTWSNDFNPDNWVYMCGNTRSVDVWFYATDVCGNVDSVMFTFSIGDVTPPVFTNCPRPDVVVDVPTNLCESYVNFSMPYAEDNCSGAVVEQTDTTGYSTGDLFPVGCTMLEFTATDSCGNQTVCTFRVIVNDNHTDPIIECPTDTSLINDPGLCGAVLDELTPYTTDNCPGNVSVIYQVFNETNAQIASGIETASGTEFPVGNNTVKYTVFDQPIFLITEVIQDGTTTGVEIGNIGPAAIDLGCARIRRTNSSADEEYMVPSGTVVTSGSVFVQNFTNIPSGELASYSIDFVDRLIDSITINDGLDGVDIFRISPIDTDTNDDFMVVNSCQAGSFGEWNPQLPYNPDNGHVTKLQSVDPNMSMCTFNVNVQDVESPTCSLVDTLEYSGGPMTIDGTTCVSSVFTVGQGTIADINLIDLNATVQNAGLVTVTLTSPSGKQITLIDNLCNNTSDIDVKLDDVATSNVSEAGCSPLGNGNTYAPLEPFTTYFGEEAQGDWTLELYSDSPNTGTLNNWTLQFLLVTYYDQEDIVAENDPGECGAEIQWWHPYYLDNCINGTMTVTYSFSNDVTGESYETEEVVLSSGGAIDLDGTLVSRYFEVGVTEVTYELTDIYGNTGYCGFTITVNDTEAPVFPQGCQDVTIQLDPGDCYAAINELPEVEDNCGVDTLYFENENGEEVDLMSVGIGITTVYAIAVDIYGNKDTCIYQIEILEYIPQNGDLACNDEINVSLNGDCEAELNADMLLEGGPYRCYENYCIEIEDANGNPHDNYFDYNDINETFTATVSDCLGSGTSCETVVNIMEKFIPEIVCPDDTVVTCNADIEPDDLGVVEILNCEPFAETLYSDELIDNGMCGNPRAEIIRTWSVNDHQGNIVSCEQHIVIKKSELDDVVFPEDVLDMDCAAVAQNPDLTEPDYTGYPTVEGIPVNY